MYFDTSYIAKFYFNEPESAQVRELVRTADTIREAGPAQHAHGRSRCATISTLDG